MSMLCPTCQSEVNVQDYLCLATGLPITKVKCTGCHKSWENLVAFFRACAYVSNLKDVPIPVCPSCGNDVAPDELWQDLGRGGVVCRNCFRCPGCGGVMFRQENDRVVCEVCGSNWHDSLEFAYDFLPKAHILQ